MVGMYKAEYTMEKNRAHGTLNAYKYSVSPAYCAARVRHRVREGRSAGLYSLGTYL